MSADWKLIADRVRVAAHVFQNVVRQPSYGGMAAEAGAAAAIRDHQPQVSKTIERPHGDGGQFFSRRFRRRRRRPPT